MTICSVDIFVSVLMYYTQLASEPAFGGLTRYGELCAIESGPATFEASSLVATEDNCYNNDGKFKI